MKKIVGIERFLLIALIISMTINLYSEDIDFRGLAFSSSLEQIIQKEGEPDETIRKSEKPDAQMMGDTLLSYHNVNVAGYESDMQIEMLNNEILGGVYSITADQKELLSNIYDPVEYSKIYNDLYMKLVNKYGEPQKANNIEKIDNPISGLYAKSVINMAPYSAVWEKDNGSIMLMLSYDATWSLLLMYMDNEIYNQFYGENNDADGL